MSEAEKPQLKVALESIVSRFEHEDKGTLTVRDGLAWAMYTDAKNALMQPAEAVQAETLRLNACIRDLAWILANRILGKTTSPINCHDSEEKAKMLLKLLVNPVLFTSPSSESYPKYCHLCIKQIKSKDDRHGPGNCVKICERCNGDGIEPSRKSGQINQEFVLACVNFVRAEVRAALEGKSK